MNIALIKAGGVGSRMGYDIPKQFVEVNNIPIIVYTLSAFEKHNDIDEILIVCIENWIDKLWDIVKKYNISKVKNIVKII